MGFGYGNVGRHGGRPFALSWSLPMNAFQAHVTIEDVLAGRPFLDADTRVSRNSRFGDDLWDFTSPDKVRLSSVPDSRLRIDWAMYCTVRDRKSTRLNSSH